MDRRLAPDRRRPPRSAPPLTEPCRLQSVHNLVKCRSRKANNCGCSSDCGAPVNSQ